MTQTVNEYHASIVPRQSSDLEGFMIYAGIPIDRTAYEVKADDEIREICLTDEGGPSLSEITIGQHSYQFPHFEPVNVGDFICALDEEDVYHVRRSVMQLRNYIPD